MDRTQLGALLADRYGIDPVSIVDAPRGFVAETFSITAADGHRYFAKLIPAWGRPAAVARLLPALEELRALGIDTISRPVPRRDGRWWLRLGGRGLILFKFVAGRTGRISDRRFAPSSGDYDFDALIALLARVHQATERVQTEVPRESFRLDFGRRFESLLDQVVRDAGPTAVQVDLQRLMARHRERIATDWRTLQALSRACRRSAWAPLLTHGDPIGNNVIVGDDGRLNLIDWDSLARGPAERDSWFFLTDDEARSAFMAAYQDITPDYCPDTLFHRFYAYLRFYEDLTGYLIGITESPSEERQAAMFADLEDVCFGWLWAAMRRADAEAGAD